MAYTGNIVYLNRRELISDPNGSIWYQGMSWSQNGHTESNMSIYGVPNTSGAYRDVNGNGLYFPAVATTSCINMCYEYEVIINDSFNFDNCYGVSILLNDSNPGLKFCASGPVTTKSGRTDTYTQSNICSFTFSIIDTTANSRGEDFQIFLEYTMFPNQWSVSWTPNGIGGVPGSQTFSGDYAYILASDGTGGYLNPNASGDCDGYIFTVSANYSGSIYTQIYNSGYIC